MNRAQRVTLVVALGIAIFAVAGTLNLVWLDRTPDWFAYSPGTPETLSQTNSYFVVTDDEAIVKQAAVWLFAVVSWAGASVWLLRTTTPEGSDG